MTASAPTLPHHQLINGLNHTPPPPISDFTSKFGTLVPKGTSIPSSWGTTRFYNFAPNSRPSASIIIKLHGGGTPAVAFTYLARRPTKSGLHVVTYDLWGNGISSTPFETHTPALMHAQLLELLSYLRWPSAHIIGFSIGGSIAATFTALYPHMAETLTLISPAGLLRKADRGWWEKLNPQPETGWEERVKKGELDTVAVEIWQRENHAGHVASLVSMWNYAGVYDQHESYRLLAKSKVEVLVLVGSEDDVFPEEMLRRGLGSVGWKGDIKVVEGAGHGIIGSHSQDVGRLLEELWRGGKLFGWPLR
ncbi:Alpha/Beta hydrolase protein [Leptodontidium sp. 2 PMI_412]|nr:Alpha/Beta hydrolase protein [Leptodontidium sp. 2 PMI_412]